MGKKYIKGALIIILSLALNIGCESELEPRVKDDIVISEGEELVRALQRFTKTRDERVQALAERRSLQEVLDNESDTVISNEILSKVAVLDQKISDLDKQVDLNKRLVISKEAVLNKESGDFLSEEEKLTLAEVKGQGFNNIEYDFRNRLTIIYEAQVEAVNNQEEVLLKLRVEKGLKSDQLKAMTEINSKEAEILKAKILKLDIEIKQVVRQQTLLVIIKDSLAEEIQNL